MGHVMIHPHSHWCKRNSLLASMKTCNIELITPGALFHGRLYILASL